MDCKIFDVDDLSRFWGIAPDFTDIIEYFSDYRLVNTRNYKEHHYQLTFVKTARKNE